MSNWVRPGLLTLQSWRFCNTHLACQLRTSLPSRRSSPGLFCTPKLPYLCHTTSWQLRNSQGRVANGPHLVPRGDLTGRAILKLTCSACGTNMSTLECERAWSHEVSFRWYQALLNSKVDGSVPLTLHVNLRIVCQPDVGTARSCVPVDWTGRVWY